MKNLILSLLTVAALFTGINGLQASSCSATISYTNFGGTNGIFSAVGSFDSLNTVFTWTFGDNTSGSGQSLTHNYDTAGAYAVTLTVRDSLAGCISVYHDTVTVPNNILSPGCSSYITTNNIDTFYTLMTQNTGVPPFTYTWLFPDGTTSTLPDPTFMINSTGYYNISVYVTDSTGCLDTANITLDADSTGIIPVSCQAYFVVTPDSSLTGAYIVSNYSVASGTVSYTWSFGDGTTSTLQYPSHTYATPGFYTICLSISSSTGCSSSFCDSSFYAYKTGGGPMSSVTVQAPTGIQNINSNNLISVYPNPAQNVLEIKMNGNDKIVKTTIYNTSGQKVAEYGSGTQLSVATLTAGMYFIEVKGTNSTYRTSFVKQD